MNMLLKLLCFVTLALLWSCADDSDTGASTISGYAQKGPFIMGTEVTLYELTTDLKQTGKTFAAAIEDPKGFFELRSVELASPYLRVSVSGNYYNEFTGAVSTEVLHLNALVDARDAAEVNINIITHIEAARVQHLVESGDTFSEAKGRAQREIFDVFSFPEKTVNASERLDISSAGDGNAMLLAASLIIQGNLNAADLTVFLSTISADLKTDGVIDQESIKAKLRSNANAIASRLGSMRDQLISYYNTIGMNADVPSVEPYFAAFAASFAQAPVVSDGYVLDIQNTSVRIDGYQLLSDGGSTTYDSGLVYSTSPDPTLEDLRSYESNSTNGVTAFVLLALKPNTKYYARFFAANYAGIAYSAPMEFTTTNASDLNPLLAYGNLTDVDGNTYPTVQIGNQLWMAQNLNVSHYANGTVIPDVTDYPAWSKLESGARSVYYNRDDFGTAYGKLYNWSAVNDSRGLCPTGWRVPNDTDWQLLITHLNGSGVAGIKLKGGFWYNPSMFGQPAIEAHNNQSGFTALPGGSRGEYAGGLFGYYNIGANGRWWSATKSVSSGYAYAMGLSYTSHDVLILEASVYNGYSVRCLKN